MANCGGWSEEPVSKEKQRPPIYNPEDYAASLKKWSKKTSTGSLYDLEPGQDLNKARTLPTQNSKDFRNPCLGMGEEMSLRQFGSVSELLTKLRADLRLSFQSFVQEFSSELLDGVSLLLELLRNIQLSQTSDAVRGPPALRRRPLLDELACLQCLWSCSSRYSECTHRLVSTSSGVYALTVCIMSTVNKTRILGLQLLAAAVPHSHSAVSEALSTLRLRYGEPVRFRFLVGMLLGGGGALQAAGLALLSALLAGAPGDQHRLYLQAELEQAGFDLGTLKKIVSKLPNPNEDVIKEIEKYEKQLIDIDTLNDKANKAQKEKDDLRHKLELLEKRVKILQEEKGILLSLEKCLQEKCYELQEEVSTLKSEHGSSNRKKTFSVKKKNTKNREESSPPEDEGISSSERSLSPDGDPQRESMVYEVFNIKNDTYDLVRNKRTHKKIDTKNIEKKSSDEEEETTIDEVIQELRNIANIDYKDQDNQRKEDSITSTVHSIQITRDDNEESEIVPSKILPHPPRKARSLIHVFIPPEEGLYRKEDNFYSSDEDSLLSYNFNECKTKFDDRLTRDKKRTESIQTSEKSSRQREYIDSMFYVTNEHTKSVDDIINMIESKKITKNLDKIEGLNSMVDIVMSEPKRSINSDNDLFIPEARSRRSIHSDNDPLIPEARSRRDNFNSFIMRSPGFGNGLRDAPASITTLVSQNSDLKKNVTLGSNYGQRSKVTDMPSGLY